VDISVDTDFIVRFTVAFVFSFGVYAPILWFINRGNKNFFYTTCALWGMSVAPLIAWGLKGADDSQEFLARGDPLLFANQYVTSAGVSEEVAKTLLILLVAGCFHGRFNLVRAATSVAMGFIMAENFTYLYIGYDVTYDFLEFVFVRNVFSAPIHIIATNLAVYGLRIPYSWPMWIAVGATYHNLINALIVSSTDFPVMAEVGGAALLVGLWAPWLYKRGVDGVYIDCALRPRFDTTVRVLYGGIIKER